jgi:hypothetical protein
LATAIRKRLPFGKLGAFAALSVADLALTWHLLATGGGTVCENNPFAGAWLAAFGWAGLALYKTLAVSMVAASAGYVSLHRPRTGARLLTFACWATAAVVLYSGWLAYRTAQWPPAASEMSRSRQLAREIVRQGLYHAAMARLSSDLVGQRCRLPEAAARLAAANGACNPTWQDVLRHIFPGRSHEECLAICLGRHALDLVREDPAELDRLADRLEGEFAAGFQSSYRFERRDGLPTP